MLRDKRIGLALLVIVALWGIAGAAIAAEGKAADDAAIRAINEAWGKAYNSNNADGLAALYAEDGVVAPPGVAAARGRAAIREALGKDAAGAAAAGLTLTLDPTRDSGMSGDLAWESGTFKAKDKSGAVVDAGKYLTVFKKTSGKWMIIRDIWNSDKPAASEAGGGAPPSGMPKKK